MPINDKKRIFEKSRIKIRVNGKPVLLHSFVQRIFINVICGILRSLKGIKKISGVSIRFTMK